MTLPASGSISFNDIRIELGVPSQAPFSLDTAENGGYGAINRCSSPSPVASNPASINEWYSYNHGATSTEIGLVDYSATSCATACALPVAGVWTLYYNTAATAIYTDTTCNTFPSVGYHALLDRSNCYDIGGSGVLNSITACTTTTTTTTTTTAACSANGASCPENDGEFSPTCCSGNCCSNICTATAC